MGKREQNRLSPAAVKNLARAEVDKKEYVSDGGNLYLQLAPPNGKSWIFRGQRDGRRYEIGLGPLRVIGLAKAREKARKLHEQILDDIDPLERRRAAKAEARLARAKAMTFQACAEQLQAAKAPTWSVIHARQWARSLREYVYPLLGPLPVDAIDTPHVMRAIEGLWREKPETASRVRSRIEQTLDFAKSRGFRVGENPARWRGHIEHMLPSRRKAAPIEHFAALAYAEVPQFMAQLRAREGAAARALELLTLCAARSGEVIGATWSEIDFVERTWSIPASRMKAGRPHVVPLSVDALKVIERMPRQGKLIFARNAAGEPLPQIALRRELAVMGCAVTPHGMRSCFSSWCSARTNFAPEVVETQLAHATGNATRAAYQRDDLLAKRRQLLAAWARYCGSPPAAGEVVAIGAAR
jgi:integrase